MPVTFEEKHNQLPQATFNGYVHSSRDALLLIQAVLEDTLPYVKRRPLERERQGLIKSGSIFVFIEQTSGIKRWTDDISWSPSRILGRFLVYRELDRQRSGRRSKEQINTFGYRRSKSVGTAYTFKEGGLYKKAMSLKVNRMGAECTIHLISYYTAEDVESQKLQRPSTSPMFKNVETSEELLKAVKVNNIGRKLGAEDEESLGISSHLFQSRRRSDQRSVSDKTDVRYGTQGSHFFQQQQYYPPNSQFQMGQLPPPPPPPVFQYQQNGMSYGLPPLQFPPMMVDPTNKTPSYSSPVADLYSVPRYSGSTEPSTAVQSTTTGSGTAFNPVQQGNYHSYDYAMAPAAGTGATQQYYGYNSQN